MVGISQITVARGALGLATLSVVAAQAQIQQLNMRTLQNSSSLLKRQVVVPGIATSPSLPLTNSTHILQHRGVPEPATDPDANSGLTRGHRQASLDENGENPVDTMGYDTAAKKEYWEGKYERFNKKQPSTTSSKDPANEVPSEGTVSNLRNKWENDIPSSANSAADSRRGSNPIEDIGDIRDMWEGNVPTDQRPGAEPLTPHAPEAAGRHQLDDGSTISDAELNDLLGEQTAKVSGLRNKFENMGSSPNPAPAGPLPQAEPPKPIQPADPAPVPEDPRPVPEAQPPQPAQPLSPLRPADLPKPGTVQDLKNKYENSGIGDTVPPKPAKPEPAPAPKSGPDPNPQLPSNPSPPADPIPPSAQEPSFADQLREFSSFDSQRKPITPPISPKSGSLAPARRPLHEKINTWEKLSDKDAKKRPEAKYELEDPALHPKPPRPEIPIDAGVDVDAAVQRGMDAVRSRNPEIKRIDKSINDLVKSMQHNAAYRELGDQQIAQIKSMQARRDAEEKEMLKQKAALANKRKHLSEERARLGTNKSERQQDVAQEAMEEFLDLFKQYNAGIDRMYETIDDIKNLIDATAEMAKISEANAAAAKELEKAIMDDRARRAAERAAANAKLGRPSKIKPIEIPPIIQSFNVDGGKISDLKTNVPPPNVPLPEPLPGSLIKTDDPMRVALDDIRVKGKLTQETADKLVEAGWGISPQAEQVLKNYNIPVDNMARAKGAIAGFASTAHLAPAGVLASSPEALELAALAGSPKILAAVGVGMAAPEIAKTVTAALPVVGGASEQALQQGVVAAQVVGVAGKETFSLITTGTTATAKSSYAILAAGTGALGAGLGLVGGFIGGLFARKHTKDHAKHAVHTVVTTQMHTKAHTKTVKEHITEVLEGKTVTVERTKAPEPTTKSSKTKSISSLQTSSSTVDKSNRGMTPIPVPFPVPIPMPPHSKHVTNLTRNIATNASSSKLPKSTGAGIPIPVPVPVPPHRTNVMDSTRNMSTKTSSSKLSKGTGKMKPVAVRPYPIPTNVTSSAGNISASAGPSSKTTGSWSMTNVTKSSGSMSASITYAIVFPTYPMPNVTESNGNMTIVASTVKVLAPGKLPLYPMANVASLGGNMTNVTSTGRITTPTQMRPFPMANVTNATGNFSASTILSNASGSWSKTSALPPYPTTNVTTSAGNMTATTSLPSAFRSWSTTKMSPVVVVTYNSTGPSVTPPYPANVTTSAWKMPTTSSQTSATITLTPSEVADTAQSMMSPYPTSNVTNWSGNMTTASPVLVLTPSQVADITSGALSWQDITSLPAQTPISQSQNVTSPSLALPTTTQPWTNTTFAMLPTTFETMVKSTSSLAPKWMKSASSGFPSPPTTLQSTRVSELIRETAVQDSSGEEFPILSHGFNLTSDFDSTVGCILPFRRRS